MLGCLQNGLKVACRTGQINTRFIQTSQSFLKDYYKILGVPKNASQKDIKKAYYQLAKKYHPDTNQDEPTAQKKFQEVSEAYEVLGDDAKRAEFDQFGSGAANNPFGQNQRQSYSNRGPQWSYQSNVDPEELFKQIFGEFSRGFGGRGSSSGFSNPFDDIFNFQFQGGQQAQTTISFTESAKGVTKEVDVLQMTGNLRNPSLNKSRIKVPIPAGISDGQTLRLSLGNQEVFVTVRVQPSDYYRREGYDIHTDANISISQAILGGIIRIQGLYEDLNIRIPPGTDSHTELTLSGRGLKHMEAYNTYGDHIGRYSC
ncbi:dnaJ homolog subfamily A member 3, mitochondrial [Eurytemora carolleeae]|uniref:dnaJ homolog subfamily A member 3, mitochondrial n=1 Tax=Eurytemora carolleeae TaxID=1294199 RepID=UPI000C785AB5|nr:dnaJ homolog subfamily A member 3, mitochondrial [Eurytemora carolleeae]|eukprot:XP_023332094.1 dnaJ homolog subfamily A member 3, mitochondrial-like [Eurytemora affinis]